MQSRRKRSYPFLVFKLARTADGPALEAAGLGIRPLLFGIVKINAHGVPFAGTHSADAVPQIDPITPLSALHWMVVHGNSETVADNPIPECALTLRHDRAR
jgi:hypothetical protein